ncbi:MAG: alpha/beta fold hydrolase [Acidobacteriota bacterium]|nr:alpha/beta fold hydrolase [Acidobacteriota bacterium]
MPRVLAVALALVLSGPSPAPEPPGAPSRFATLDGNRIHYQVAGSGPKTLVFVHGWSCDLSVWRFQVPAFAPKARVIVLDLPGHGRSDAPQIAYTMDFFARAIDAVLRDAGVSRATLIGHSMGTPVVRQFFRRFPEKTAALVAVDGSLRVLISDAEARERFLAPYRGPEYRERLERFADAMFSADQAQLRDPMKAVMTKTPQHVLVSAAESMLDPANFREDPIRVPLLSVLAKSPFWGEDYEAFLRGLAPQLDFKVMEGVRHFLMLEKPDEFNAILAAFLEKQRG